MLDVRYVLFFVSLYPDGRVSSSTACSDMNPSIRLLLLTVPGVIEPLLITIPPLLGSHYGGLSVCLGAELRWLLFRRVGGS